MKDHKKFKTSFYIDSDLAKKIVKLTKNSTQTQFINESIRQRIEQIEKEKSRKELLNFMHSIKPIKMKKTSLELVHEAREQRMKTILGKHYKKPK